MRRWWWLLLLIPVFLALGFVVWALTGPGVMPEAQAALTPDSLVEVDADRWLVFRPADQDPTHWPHPLPRRPGGSGCLCAAGAGYRR